MILAYDEIARGVSAASNNLVARCRNNITALLSISLILIGIAITLRNQGLYAVVFADEYTYSRFSRLSAAAEAPVPSFLFFSIYKYTNYCGDGFLACARLFNTIFFVSAAPFIFSVSSRIVSRPYAALIAILSVIGPINTYTAYYMPESLYFLAFWVFSWSILGIDRNSGYINFFFVSFIFSLTALVKPHSLFFIPGIILYFAYIIRQAPEQAWVARWLKVSMLFVAVAVTVKLALGFALAGKAGVTFFGAVYGSIASGAATHYVDLVKQAGVSLVGHALALSILFGMPLAAVLLSLRKVLSRNEVGGASLGVALYTLAIFATLVPVVVLFSASVANMGGGETPFRLHMRYYNFAFPLLLIVAADGAFDKRERMGCFYVTLPVIILIAQIYAIITLISPYAPGLADSPEIRGITYNRNVFYALSGINLVSFIIWIFNSQVGCKVFLFLFYPFVVVLSSYFSSLELRTRLHPDSFDNAGIFARHYLEGDDASNLVVMGSNPAGLLRSLFYVDNPKASMVVIPAGSPADLSKVLSSQEWLLLVGGHAPPPNSRFKLDLNGFSLFQLAGSDKINFARRPWPENLVRVQGLSSAEAWGTWSEGPLVTLEFVKPLPKNLILRLKARAFGPNVGRNFMVHVGGESAEFMLSSSPAEIVIPLRNSEASSSISFSIPTPASPLELGSGQDSRKLGIAFYQLSVQDVTQ